jgi:Tn3 transposase DDE domain
LNGLARHRLNSKLIIQNWDDLLRVAGSLKLGTLSASELIRALQRGSKRSLLARALGELGRIPKTLHLLTFIDEPFYRRRILTQLNRGEGRHRLARKCFHGQRGELRQRYREGQEDQLGALGLVVNALVLWNTRYMDAALSHLRSQSAEVKPEDVVRLSPLADKHFNVLGRYTSPSRIRFCGATSGLFAIRCAGRTPVGSRSLTYVLVPMIVEPQMLSPLGSLLGQSGTEK